MRIFEIIQESFQLLENQVGRVFFGMLVQTPEQFLKSHGQEIKMSEEIPDIQEPNSDSSYTPRAKYTSDIKPIDQATPDPRNQYSKVVSPEDIAKIAHQRNSYVIYYNDKNKLERRITQEPIYLDRNTIDQVSAEMAKYVEDKFPDTDPEAKRLKAYTLTAKELKKKAIEKALVTDSDLDNALTNNIVKIKQLKADFYMTPATKVKNPAIHRSSIEIKDENDNVIYDLDSLAASITKRPEKLLKQNAKIVKSSGEGIAIANIGIPAIVGLVVDEKSKEFRVITTCPGAGECKAFCYATRGNYVKYKASGESQMQILNFIFNDPEGFKNKIIGEIKAMVQPGVKVYVRWHDSGDFYDLNYLHLAFDVARAVPEATIYIYTKIASVVKDPAMPDNFIVNFSQGSKPIESKQIDLKTTKHSAVVPEKLFKDKKTTGIGLKELQQKDPEAQRNMKQALAKHYELKPESILTYDEMLETPESNEKNIYNVMIVPSVDGDLSAARRDVLGSYLLFH